MASRTQLRLGQITGSFGDAEGKIVDNLPVAGTLGTIPIGSGSLVTVLSQLASSIQRINGGVAFSTNAAGVFTQNIKIGAGGNEFEINESGDDITLDVTTADKDLIFTANPSGGSADTEVMRIDGSATSLLIAGTKKIELNDAGTFIHSPADGKILIESDGAVDDAIEIKTSNAAGEIVIESAHTAGVAVHIDANANAGSIVDIDAGILQIDATGVAGINSGGTLSLGTANSGVAVNIGHGTSEVTIGDNLTVTGDLTVNGDTVTVNTTNLTVDDPIIVMAHSASAGNTNGGIAIMSGSNTANQAMVFGRVANDMWGTGRKDIQDGEVISLADMTLINFATKGISINSTDFSHALAINGSNLKMGSTGDVEIDPDGGNVLFGDGANTIVDLDVANAKLTIHDDAQVANKFEISVGNNGETTLTSTDADAAVAHVSVVADGNITLDSAGDIVLDADGQDITLKDGGTEYGNIRLNVNADGENGNDIILSSSLDSLGLDAAGGKVVLMNAGTQFLYLEHNSNDAQIYPAGNGANDIIFQDGAESSNEVFRVDGALQALAMPTQNAAGNNANTGILTFNGNTDVNEAIYGDGGALYLRSNAVNFKLPTADGNAGEVLETDGGGNLSFVPTGAEAIKKGIKILSAGVAAGSDVNFNAVDAGATISGLSTAESQGKALDVFVNGQLLVSGSESQRSGGSRDYTVKASTVLTFAFDLEVDDVVQLIKR